MSGRTDADEETLGRAIAATAPIALGALSRALEPVDLADWVAMLPDRALTRPDHLLDPNEAPAAIYRRLRRYGRPWWVRALGIGG
ncbi:MAG: hypothetical protein ACC662_02450 [Planctomycetota bacterium]